MEKYTIKRIKLDAYDPQMDSSESIATIECSTSVAKMICYALNVGEANEGDPYTSYKLLNNQGETISLNEQSTTHSR